MRLMYRIPTPRSCRSDESCRGELLPRGGANRSEREVRYTATNAYSGNNGRAAILNSTQGASVVYTSGNAGNGANPQPDGIIIGAGAQILTPQVKALVAQSPGIPTPVGSFNITQLGDPSDKIGKDTNFRGLTVFDNVLYYTNGGNL